MNKYLNKSAKSVFEDSDILLFLIQRNKLTAQDKSIINEFKNSIMRLNDTIFEMGTSWFTKTPKGFFSNFHSHNNCMFSGVFYFDDSSDLQFQDHSTKQFYVVPNKYNDFNCDAYTIIPKKNMIVFFDSRLFHAITPNNSDMMRYSLAFNFIPTRGLHEGDSQICFKLDLDK